MSKNFPAPKVILITGTSSGFGMLTAARLASSGHHVFATMRDLAKKDLLLAEVKKRGGKLNLLPLDVTSRESMQSVVAMIAESFGYLDVLINNAGYGLGGFFEDLTEEEIRRQMETNFFGVQNVTRQAIPLLRSRKAGKILNISSIAGLQSSPCFGAYNASKWALEGFTESLRYELKFFGIDVFLIEPGTYKTKIFHENAQYAKNFFNPSSPYYHLSQRLYTKIMNYLDQCRRDPEEVAILIEKLIMAQNPPFRNIPDSQTRWHSRVKRWLPFSIYSWIVWKILFNEVKKPDEET